MSRDRALGAIQNQPRSQKLLQENAGQFFVHNLPMVKYFCVDWELPDIAIDVRLRQPTPYLQRPTHGTKLTFSPVSITFQVDQNLDNYVEIFDWIRALAPPDHPSRHAAWIAKNSRLNNFKEHASYSDGTLFLYTTRENPNIEVQFKDLFPVSISKLSFSSTTEDAKELVCTAQFEYLSYDFVRRDIVE